MKRVTLGIGGALGHDSNTAILVDGKLVAAVQEERFTRFKHDPSFPQHSIDFCLKQAGLNSEDVTTCVFAEKVVQYLLCRPYSRVSNFVSQSLGRHLPLGFADHWTYEAKRRFVKAEFKYVWHHLSHAAAAFHTSDFDSAAFLCVDGIGEDSSASIGYFRNGVVEILSEQPYENGLGYFYTAMTDFLGFPQFGDEYKVMGLAPYGRPLYVQELLRLFSSGKNGGIQLKYQGKFTKDSKSKFLSIVEDCLGLSRRRESENLNQTHMDLASSLQSLFETEILKMAEYARTLTKEDNLVFCGGCAQNCVTAGKLQRSGLFKQIFASPVGGDMGSGLGAAVFYESLVSDGRKLKLETSGYHLGPPPGPPPKEAMKYLVPGVNDIFLETAKLLTEGKLVGWVRGGAELGARALGARSILADPRTPGMQTVLNLKIKFRESFRPFAPAVLAEEAENWFECYGLKSDYMQYTSYLKDRHRFDTPNDLGSFQEQLNFPRCLVPSIVHVDFSARLQTVDKAIHPDFHRLISEFFKLTSVPMLINTSFNVNKEPIVLTAEDAWDCFINTDIDYLAIDDQLFKNPFERSREEKLAWREKFVTF